MLDERIPYNGCSLRFLECELSTVKDLITKVKFMVKPKNFTYMDCANLSETLETMKRSLEAVIEEKKHEEQCG